MGGNYGYCSFRAVLFCERKYLARNSTRNCIVLIPPLGYFKDKNTRKVVVVEEQAEIVRRIFDMYISGYGLKAIAKILNDEGIKSPG